jgi:molybdopterin-guanine dinucleotide biosynthesis protein B
VHRPAIGKPPIHPSTRTSSPWRPTRPVATALPVLDLNDPGAIAQFIVNHLGLR